MNSALPSLSVDLEDPYTVPLNSRFSVRLYRDCRPNYLETGALQKGLVLLFGNRELIEEGVGFGVPVVKYTDKTFFSSKATVTAQSSNRRLHLNEDLCVRYGFSKEDRKQQLPRRQNLLLNKKKIRNTLPQT